MSAFLTAAWPWEAVCVSAFLTAAWPWEAGGVSAAPRAPCVRQGAGAGYGAEPDGAAVGRREEKEPQKREEIFPLFCGKISSRFCSTSPLAERKLCCGTMIGR